MTGVATRADRPRQDTTASSLAARVSTRPRVRAVSGLFQDGDTSLLDQVPRARRLLAIVDDSPGAARLRTHLAALRATGRLDAYQLVRAGEVAGLGAAEAIDHLATVAKRAGLGRTDAFVTYCGPPASDWAAIVAALYRRHTSEVRAVADESSLHRTLRAGSGTRTSLPDVPIGIPRRRLSVLVDADRLPLHAVDPAPGEEVATVGYTVEWGHGVLGATSPLLDDWLPAHSRVLAVVDAFATRAVADLCRYLSRRRAPWRVVPVASSHHVKRMIAVTEVLKAADAMGMGAEDRLLAVGGGTVLDLTGTAALLHPRGTPYVRVPTTLVGQIDAGIGLKVGVDAAGTKNLLGGYHPPLACLCDPRLLRSLPPRELRNGLAEAVKIAVVADAELFDLIERHHDRLLDGAAGELVLRRATEAMLGQLRLDPFEEDPRRLPDFGHELGHLVEVGSGYRLGHGEAVSVGMAFSSHLALETGRLTPASYERIITLLRAIGLPVFHDLCEPQQLWRWLCEDISRYKGGRPHLVVPTGIGSGDYVDSLDELDAGMLGRACRGLAAR
jgi:3-dehydroquinate synthetase